MQRFYKKSFLIQFATCAAVFTALVLVGAKAFAWHLTGALSIKASLLDSVLDGLASVINFWAIRAALKPADDCHTFGHGKAEALASLFQALIISITALWLLYEAFGHIFIKSEPPIYHATAIWVMFFSTGMTLILVLFQNYVIKQTNSLVIRSDALHYKTDILTNIGVLLSLFIAQSYHFPILDTVIGALIAVFILHSSWDIGRKSLDILMDHEIPDHEREQIIQISSAHPKALGVHALKTRSSGQKRFIQLHLDLPRDLRLYEAHTIADEVEDRLQEAFPDAEIIIHQDPVS